MAKVNFKSDFDFLLGFKTCDAQQEDVCAFPPATFRGTVTSGVSSIGYDFSWDGEKGENCRKEGARLRVICDSHGLGAGKVRVDLYIDLPDDLYPDTLRTIHFVHDTGIELVRGNGDCCANGIDVELALNYAVLTNYDLAVRNGYEGTFEEYVAEASALVENARECRAAAVEAREIAENVATSAQSIEQSAETISEIVADISSLLPDLAAGKARLAQVLTERGASVADDASFDELAQAAGRLYRPDIEGVFSSIGYDSEADYGWLMEAIENAEKIKRAWDERDKGDNEDMEWFSFVVQANIVDERSIIPKIDTSRQRSFWRAFRNANINLIPDLDTSNGTKFGGMFEGCSNLKRIPQLDFSNGINLDYLFYNCSSLEGEIGIDASSSNGHLESMFRNCSKLSKVTIRNIPRVTHLSCAFQSCNNISEWPFADGVLSECANLYCAFSGCNRLIQIPDIYSQFCSDARQAFQNCTALRSAGNINLTHANIQSFFNGCTSLERVESLDVSSVTSIDDNTFNECNRLCYLKLIGLGKSSRTSWPLNKPSAWGSGSEENRQSLVNSLLTYSHDRAAAGMSTATIQLHANAKARLTSEEIAAITAKGYTIA